MKRVLSLLAATILLLSVLPGAIAEEAADTVIYGNIYTSDEAQPFA